MGNGLPGLSLDHVQLSVEMEYKVEQEHVRIPSHNMEGNRVREMIQRRKNARIKNVQVKFVVLMSAVVTQSFFIEVTSDSHLR